MYRVLIVDDEPLIREGLVRLIDWGALGCRVAAQAENGQEALALLMEQPVDIVVCDIRMPGMDGLELGARIDELHLPARLIYLTAYPDFGYAQAAVRRGAVDYVLKSSYLERMPEAVGRLVERLERERREQTERDRLRALVHSMGRDQGGDADAARKTSPLIGQALDYIVLHYAQDINLSGVARQLHVNSSYLGSLFRKETGESMVDAINRCRIERAMQLLNDPDRKVFEVAEEVGFADPAYFTNVFTRHTGLSPTAFRAGRA